MMSSSQPFLLVSQDHLLPPTMVTSPDDHAAQALPITCNRNPISFFSSSSSSSSSSSISQTIASTTACLVNNPSHTSSSPPNLWGLMDQLWSAADKNGGGKISSLTADQEHCYMRVSAVKMKRPGETGKGGGRRRKVREPRFCFKTLSEVDVLDDGYKWRKYGQKVVKNTQHPRSYFRCTQDNCRVKKRVERLAEDPRMVITTYEGRHAHYPWQEQEESHAPTSSDGFFW